MLLRGDCFSPSKETQGDLGGTAGRPRIPAAPRRGRHPHTGDQQLQEISSAKQHPDTGALAGSPHPYCLTFSRWFRSWVWEAPSQPESLPAVQCSLGCPQSSQTLMATRHSSPPPPSCLRCRHYPPAVPSSTENHESSTLTSTQCLQDSPGQRNLLLHCYMRKSGSCKIQTDTKKFKIQQTLPAGTNRSLLPYVWTAQPPKPKTWNRWQQTSSLTFPSLGNNCNTQAQAPTAGTNHHKAKGGLLHESIQCSQ